MASGLGSFHYSKHYSIADLDVHVGPEVENPFPSPPDRYKLFTDQNISLLKTLRERTQTKLHDPVPPSIQQSTLEGEPNLDDAPEDLTVLERPRYDWIIEGGRYSMYANIWKVGVWQRPDRFGAELFAWNPVDCGWAALHARVEGFARPHNHYRRRCAHFSSLRCVKSGPEPVSG